MATGVRLVRDRFAFGPANVLAPYPNTNPTDYVFGKDCSPTMASDGVLRCIPNPGSSSIYYADAACAQPVVASHPPLGTWTAQWVDGAVSVHQVTGYYVPTELYWRAGPGCVSGPVPKGEYATLAEILPTKFLAVTIGD